MDLNILMKFGYKMVEIISVTKDEIHYCGS